MPDASNRSKGSDDFKDPGDWSCPPTFPWASTPPSGVKLPQDFADSKLRVTFPYCLWPSLRLKDGPGSARAPRSAFGWGKASPAVEVLALADFVNSSTR